MKTGLWFLGTWWGAAFAYFVLAVVAAIVAGKGRSAAETAVFALGCLGLLLFLGGTGVFWKMAAGNPNRTVLSCVHVVVQLGTLTVLGFGTLVAFNR